MKFLLILLLLVSTITYGQDFKIQYRYYYNSDMIFNQKLDDKNERLVIDRHKNSLIGGEMYIPFSTFDDYSPFKSERFSLNASAYYLYDHNANQLYQQYYDVGLNFKPFEKHNIHLSVPLHVEEITPTTTLSAWKGYDFKIGLSYNVVEQKIDEPINFYGSMSYIIVGKYNTINPNGFNTNRTGDFYNTIGAVLNIKNVFTIDQSMNIITELSENATLPFVTFSPYYSDFKTKFTLKIKQAELDFTHICFHPFVSNNKNPKIDGALNSVGLIFNL